MRFIFAVLLKVSEGTEGNQAAKEAYHETLSRHHGFIIKKAFEVGLMTAPSTETMLLYLGPDKVSLINTMYTQNFDLLFAIRAHSNDIFCALLHGVQI
jgi:hypothetical protein